MSLRFKRHYKLLVLLALVAAVLIVGLGNQAIVAYTLPGNGQAVVQVTSYSSNVALFVNSVAHSILAVQ